MDSIWFGPLRFTGPHPVETAWAPRTPGLCTLLIRNWKHQPAPYEPLSFGQSEDLNAYVAFWRELFARRTGTRGPKAIATYVSYCPLVRTTRESRDELEAGLTMQYPPRLVSARSLEAIRRSRVRVCDESEVLAAMRAADR